MTESVSTSGVSTDIEQQTKTSLDLPWTVVVYDDPVNLMDYVTYVFKKVFGYSEAKAKVLMLEVHNKGKSLVWSGNKEKAEFYMQELLAHQLYASMEQEI